MLNIFVNTWGNYNVNGADGVEWITLPMGPDELAEELNRIAENMGDPDPEWVIHDYEWETPVDLCEIGEMERIASVNAMCEELDAMDERDVETVAAAVEAFGCTLREAIDGTERGKYVFYSDLALDDVANEIFSEIVSNDVPEFLVSYFDFDAFARDLSFDGYVETTTGVICDC